MDTTKIFDDFVKKGDFSQENIDNLLISTNYTEKKLIAKAFKLLGYYIARTNEDNKYNDIMSKIVDLISFLCEKTNFNKKEIEINKERIKKYRESLYALSNKYLDQYLLDTANRLDEIVIAKMIDTSDLVILIKSLIDRKEDVNIIKKIIGANKAAILSNNNELFDHIFNLSMQAIDNDDRDIFYYITLLKIFYTSKIDRKKYIDLLNKHCDPSNPHGNEIYMIILGVRRSLTPEQILDKYEITEDLPYSKIYVPKSGYYDDDKLITIDSVSTYIRDDALSIRRDGNLYIYGVHIIDIPSIIKPGSDLDNYALHNFECKYMSGGKRTQLYHRGVEDQLSLNEGEYRNLLSLYVVINEYGEVQDYYFMPTVQRIASNLTYSQCDSILDNRIIDDEGKTLRDMYKLAKALESKNSDRLKYWNIKNLSSKEMLRATKSDAIVRESMILYNILMGNEAKEEGFPFTFRIQDQEYISYLIEQEGIEVNKATKELISEIYLESQYSTIPRRHTGLNTPVYCQATAPGRRYPDSYNQRLYHHFKLGDIHFNFSPEHHDLLIHYFNQRAEELSLMSSEYNRELKLTRKK